MAHIGRYELLSELGRGGMGVVWLGFDPILKRSVAVKLLHPPQGSPEEQSALQHRFLREGEAAATLSHLNIVAVHDVVHQDGQVAIVMEYVEGQSLRAALPAGTIGSPEQVTQWIAECAAALDHAHTRGVVHRDIKPGNIMIDPGGTVKVTDFGIAKLLRSNTDLTGGLAIGTLQYMSPEQLNAKAVDGRSDQYSLAVLAYEMLTGRAIHDADTFESWCMSVTGEQPVPPTRRNAALPESVDAVFEKALAKDREARFHSCSEFAAKLVEAFAAPTTRRDILPPAVLEPVPAIPSPRRRTIPIAGGAALCAIATAFGVYTLVRPQHAEHESAIRNPPSTGALPQPAAPAVLALGVSRVNGIDRQTYVWIAPGTFRMGCSSDDTACDGDEKPARRVEITKGFWIGQTEVTQSSFRRLAGLNPSHFKGEGHPVENVTWNEAREFCSMVGLRLPTEAEWEFAARAGDDSSRYGALLRIAWFEDNAARSTHPVKDLQPNRWGLYDMLGNVWEWMSDWHAETLDHSDVQDPKGPPGGQYRVVRGGSWSNPAKLIRVSNRNGTAPGGRYNLIGFRCAGESLP